MFFLFWGERTLFANENPPTPSHNVFFFCRWFLVQYCVTWNTNSPGITISWWPRLHLIRFCLKRIRDQNEFEELLLKMSNTNNLVWMDGEPHIYFGTVTWSSISTYLHSFIYLLGCCVDIYKSIGTATNVLLYGKKASLVCKYLLRGHTLLVAQSYSLTMLAEYQESSYVISASKYMSLYKDDIFSGREGAGVPLTLVWGDSQPPTEH